MTARKQNVIPHAQSRPRPLTRGGSAVLVLLLIMVLLGCGKSSSDKPAIAAVPSREQAQQRAQELLDDWSATLTSAILTAQKRGKAAQVGDQAAYERADVDLRPQLRIVKHFASQGREVMSRFPRGALQVAVVADGDAWQEWALALDRPGEISLKRAREIADLATVAFTAHERAYSTAGKKPPAAFQRRPDQR